MVFSFPRYIVTWRAPPEPVWTALSQASKWFYGQNKLFQMGSRPTYKTLDKSDLIKMKIFFWVKIDKNKLLVQGLKTQYMSESEI